MHPAIRGILGRRIASVLVATKCSPGCTGRERFTRLYLGFDDGRLYELWIHATDELHGAKGLDQETGLDRVRMETCEGGGLEAFFLDPADQAEADRLIATGPFYRLLREDPVRLHALRNCADWYRKRGQDPAELYRWALECLRPEDRQRVPGVEVLG